MKEPSACVMFFLALTVILGLSYGVQGGYQDYCVIGAGPSGLQMGYFLASAGRDYIIFERSNVSGNFYVNYPRHRKLISINKRWTGKTNKEYLDYLRDYQQRLALNVQFNTEIRNVRKEVCEGAPDGHVYTMVDQRDVPYKCGRLIIATGIGKPNIPDIEGMDLVDGYEDMSLNKDDYEGQTVLILGRGNSAFETATHIYGSTNLIHMIARSRVRLSWATHYVGDLRAINNELLDTYQLKSLDGVLEASLSEVAIVKDADGKLALKIVDSGPEEESEDTFDNFAMREPYDRIIRCLGFTFDNMDHTGMFVAGTASHSLDFRKSAGGFIHGFRYSARALHRLLEWRYHGNAWPSTTVPHQQLLTHILKRINEASGIYQMFSVLGDVIILGNETYTYLEEFPINLVHNLYEMSGHKGSKIIVLNLQYGPNFSGPGNDIFRLDRATGDPSDAHKSNFLHPAFYYYEKLPTEHQMKYKGMSNHLPRPDLLHHIVEDFLTTWDASTSHILPLRRFLENVLNKDMRNYFAEDCMEMALTNLDVPYSCQEFYMNGAGLAGSTLHMSK
ncbi:FXRD2-like protein [Mya arenaria]|uniref:FXRD2-like protein n=1 Tax=Mya arenaria TaxID=6604 RepID=A0ABY7DLN7_MYAAR|nr:FXRD2-like protein [Mya arenaria]